MPTPPLPPPSDFVPDITNPFFDLQPGTTFTTESPDHHEVDTFVVTRETKLIDGVVCHVIKDTALVDGEVVEKTNDYFAQDKAGNVWYFGEDTKSYSNGAVVSTHGSWEAGVEGALPGIVMPATPAVTQPPTPYRQEYYPCEAEDQAEVIELGVTITVKSGTYKNCIRTREFTRLDPTGPEYKTYCPGIGNVLVEDETTNERLEELTAVTIP